MTPFMLRVAELIGSTEAESDEPDDLHYRTRPSAPGPATLGAARHVAVRSRAEQVLCEANAVLAEPDDHLGLVDEAVADELRFSVLFRGRAVRVSTAFDHGQAIGRLIGDGVPVGPAHELESADDVANLLLQLIASGDPTRHPVVG
jgi:hypothetical protein